MAFSPADIAAFDYPRNNFDTLDERFADGDQVFNRIEGHLRNLIRSDYERKVVENLNTRLARAFDGARRISAEYPELLAAYTSGALNIDDWEDLHLAGAIATGLPRGLPGARNAFIAIEVSLVVDVTDVERAARRAAIPRKAGFSAVGCAVGRRVADDAQESASKLGVTVVIER